MLLHAPPSIPFAVRVGKAGAVGAEQRSEGAETIRGREAEASVPVGCQRPSNGFLPRRRGRHRAPNRSRIGRGACGRRCVPAAERLAGGRRPGLRLRRRGWRRLLKRHATLVGRGIGDGARRCRVVASVLGEGAERQKSRCRHSLPSSQSSAYPCRSLLACEVCPESIGDRCGCTATRKKQEKGPAHHNCGPAQGRGLGRSLVVAVLAVETVAAGKALVTEVTAFIAK